MADVAGAKRGIRHHLGYMPVTQEAFDAYLPAAVEQLSNPMYVSLYETYLKMRESYTFYYAPQMENFWTWKHGLKICPG